MVRVVVQTPGVVPGWPATGAERPAAGHRRRSAPDATEDRSIPKKMLAVGCRRRGAAIGSASAYSRRARRVDGRLHQRGHVDVHFRAGGDSTPSASSPAGEIAAGECSTASPSGADSTSLRPAGNAVVTGNTLTVRVFSVPPIFTVKVRMAEQDRRLRQRIVLRVERQRRMAQARRWCWRIASTSDAAEVGAGSCRHEPLCLSPECPACSEQAMLLRAGRRRAGGDEATIRKTRGIRVEVGICRAPWCDRRDTPPACDNRSKNSG